MSNSLGFWSLILLLTGVSWLCLGWSLLSKSSEKIGFLGRFFLIIFPIATVGFYYLLGNSHQLSQYWLAQRHNAEVERRLAEIKDPQQLVDQLKERLQENPTSTRGWFLLGQLYLSQHQYREAKSAFGQAYKLEPKSSEYFLAWAKADFFENKGHLTPALATQLRSMLESQSIIDPLEALNLLAMDFYAQKKYHQAVRYWQKALTLVQPESSDSQTLLDMINQAQRLEEETDHGRNHR